MESKCCPNFVFQISRGSLYTCTIKPGPRVVFVMKLKTINTRTIITPINVTKQKQKKHFCNKKDGQKWENKKQGASFFIPFNQGLQRSRRWDMKRKMNRKW